MTTKTKGPRPTAKNADAVAPQAQQQSAEDAARLRAHQCNEAVTHCLEKFNCRIVPFFEMEQVGQGPLTKAIIQTQYGLVPNP
jgi:hypothetical protein